MTSLATLIKPNTNPATLIEQAKQMAAAGLGWEDLMVRLDISRASARAFVLGIGAKR